MLILKAQPQHLVKTQWPTKVKMEPEPSPSCKEQEYSKLENQITEAATKTLKPRLKSSFQ
jgi:hypothetical protein